MNHSKYYYGLEDQEIYYSNSLDEVYEENEGYLKPPYEIIEMKVSRKSGEKWCNWHNVFIDECTNLLCGEYVPRNGKNGICKYSSYGLIATGAKWECIGERKFKKISGRKKDNGSKRT